MGEVRVKSGILIIAGLILVSYYIMDSYLKVDNGGELNGNFQVGVLHKRTEYQRGDGVKRNRDNYKNRLFYSDVESRERDSTNKAFRNKSVRQDQRIGVKKVGLSGVNIDLDAGRSIIPGTGKPSGFPGYQFARERRSNLSNTTFLTSRAVVQQDRSQKVDVTKKVVNSRNGFNLQPEVVPIPAPPNTKHLLVSHLNDTQPRTHPNILPLRRDSDIHQLASSQTVDQRNNILNATKYSVSKSYPHVTEPYDTNLIKNQTYLPKFIAHNEEEYQRQIKSKRLTVYTGNNGTVRHKEQNQRRSEHAAGGGDTVTQSERSSHFLNNPAISGIVSQKDQRRNTTLSLDDPFEGRLKVACGALGANPREYINPVRALLEQQAWTGPFLEAIYEGVNKEDIYRPVHVYLPSTTTQILPPVQIDPSTGDKGKPESICCERLFQGDQTYLNAVFKTGRANPKIYPNEEEIIHKSGNCRRYLREMKYVVDLVSDCERDFPLAFSILAYKDIGQLEHLLRAIYRPHNYYCLHIDTSSSPAYHRAAQSMVKCLTNVKIVSKSVKVQWGTSSTLEAELQCARDLWDQVQHKSHKWKYFINLTGQEFPLKTNWEIVQILKAYNGAVDVSASVSKYWRRWDCVQQVVKGEHVCRRRNSAPAYNYTLAQGQTHVALTYAFVDYVLHHRVAQELYRWLEPTFCPDESFYNTLFSSPQLHVPSAYTGPPNEDYHSVHPMVRYKRWYDWKGCQGRVQRQICIVATWDLPELRKRPEMFVNKLEADYHPLAYHCLHQWYQVKVLEEQEAVRAGVTPQFDTKPFTLLPWIKQHL